MKAVSLHINTNSRFSWLFLALAKLTGADYSLDTVRSNEMVAFVKKGEKDIAEGKGIVFTIDQLQSLNNEVA